MVKDQFPIFEKHPELLYLDSAATSQKPKSVVSRLANFYSEENANIHRGVYDLSWKATEGFEQVRNQLATFLGTQASNIAFVNGTTQAVNLVALSLEAKTSKNSNIVTSVAEHHANFIPWQQLCKRIGCELRIVELDDDLQVDIQKLEDSIDKNSVLVSLNHISNTTGAINPIESISEITRKKGVPLFVDGAQSAAVHGVKMKDIGADFFAFSMHKAFGPFGVGVLYVSDEQKEKMLPSQFGGGAIERVGLEETTYLPFPHRFEPGTPNVAEVIASGAAIEFIQELEMDEIQKEIRSMEKDLRNRLKTIEGIQVVGEKTTGAGIISFFHDTVHPHDLASYLNQSHIAVRAGLHCTQPLLNYLEIPATIRASFSVYNNKEDVNKMVNVLEEAVQELQ